MWHDDRVRYRTDNAAQYISITFNLTQDDMFVSKKTGVVRSHLGHQTHLAAIGKRLRSPQRRGQNCTPIGVNFRRRLTASASAPFTVSSGKSGSMPRIDLEPARTSKANAPCVAGAKW